MDELASLQYTTDYGPDISAGSLFEERKNDQVFLLGRLRSRLYSLNPNIPEEAIEDAIRKIIRNDSQDLVANNRSFHRMLVNGIDVEYTGDDGRIIGDKVWLIDFDKPENNEFLALNQFTVEKGDHTNRRPAFAYFPSLIIIISLYLKSDGISFLYV